MDPLNFDVVVIGSGAGTKLALPAARLGLSTALIEHDAFGGTCLNRGCIPSKMLLYPAEILEVARQAARLGISVGVPDNQDFGQIISRISAEVDRTSGNVRAGHEGYPNLTLFSDRARFVDDHTLQVGSLRVRGRKIFIAAGASPFVPDIPGLKGTPFMTSREALRREQLPRSIAVLGGGYIACELGFAYGAYGARVDFLVRSRLMRGIDREIATEFARAFGTRHGIHAGFSTESVSFDGRTFRVEGRSEGGNPQSLEAEALLVATGIRPETDQLGLERTHINRDPQRFIVVNDRLETTAPGVFALGDCIGRYFFRHTANYEGEYLLRTALRGIDRGPIDYGPVPYAVFTHPQIAGVGASEEELRAGNVAYVAGRASYSDSTPGMARMSEHGMAKVLACPATGRILGAHIVGDEASTMIHLFIAAMKKGATIADMMDMIFIHPALPEVARDAIRDAAGRMPS